MKKMKNRIMVWTSEQCTEIGAAWEGGFEQGMPLTLIEPEKMPEYSFGDISAQGRRASLFVSLSEKGAVCLSTNHDLIRPKAFRIAERFFYRLWFVLIFP